MRPRKLYLSLSLSLLRLGMSEMVTLVYEATVDDGRGHHIKEEFSYRLPGRLVGPPPLEEVKNLIHRLIWEHTGDLLRKAPFLCLCQQPATRLVHHALPYLRLSKPRVVDLPQPICQREACDIAAKQQWQATMQQMQQELQTTIHRSLACQHCCASSGLQKCGRCSVIAYCSKACQQADWPRHKRACRAAAQ